MPEIRKNNIALGCPTIDSHNFLDIFYPQILAVWEETGVFQHPQAFALIDPFAQNGNPKRLLIASVDTILIGRNTFDVVLKPPTWPYSDKRVVVLSHRPLDASGITGRVEQMSGDPAHIAQELAATGTKHIYVDGGIVGQEFLRTSLIHHITITRIPELIGDGIPLFGSVPRDIKLRHIGKRQPRPEGKETTRTAPIAQAAF